MYKLEHNGECYFYLGTAKNIASPYTVFEGTEKQCMDEIERLGLKDGRFSKF